MQEGVERTQKMRGVATVFLMAPNHPSPSSAVFSQALLLEIIEFNVFLENFKVHFKLGSRYQKAFNIWKSRSTCRRHPKQWHFDTQ